MLLTQSDIKQALVNGSLGFDGRVRKDSLLLTLGRHLQLFAEDTQIIDPFDCESSEKMYGPLLSDWAQVELRPQQFVLVSSAEHLRLDAHHYALMSTLSHIARMGLMAHPASFFVDRGYAGYLTFEVYNFSPHVILLREGMPFAKLAIFRVDPDNLVNDNAMPIDFYYRTSDQLRSAFCEEFSRGTGGKR